MVVVCFFFSSRRRHTRCALVTGVQTCALPICRDGGEDQDPSAEYLADAGLLRVDPPPFDLRFDEDALHAINEARTIARRWAGLLCIYCHFEPLLLRRRMKHVPGARSIHVGCSPGAAFPHSRGTDRKSTRLNASH